MPRLHDLVRDNSETLTLGKYDPPPHATAGDVALTQREVSVLVDELIAALERLSSGKPAPSATTSDPVEQNGSPEAEPGLDVLAATHAVGALHARILAL